MTKDDILDLIIAALIFTTGLLVGLLMAGGGR